MRPATSFYVALVLSLYKLHNVTKFSVENFFKLLTFFVTCIKAKRVSLVSDSDLQQSQHSDNKAIRFQIQ